MVLVISNYVKSQNLIINPSFEDTIITYNQFIFKGTLFNAKAWKQINTANYYWYGNIDGLRNSKVIETKARTGNCFAGIYINTISVSNREFIIGELNEPLIQGCDYSITIYIKFSQRYKYILNDLDISFSLNAPNILKDSEYFTINKMDEKSDGWMLLYGEYKALGNEKYISIGKWNKEIKKTRNKNKSALKEGIYVYIDDVEVIPIVSCHIDNRITKVINETSYNIENFPVSIYYKFGSSEIDTIYFPRLDSVAYILKNNDSFYVEIIGFTDSLGNISYNENLSYQRAQKVTLYLKEKGINEKRIKSYGMGSCPIISTEDWRKRKVDIIILKGNEK